MKVNRFTGTPLFKKNKNKSDVHYCTMPYVLGNNINDVKNTWCYSCFCILWFLDEKKKRIIQTEEKKKKLVKLYCQSLDETFLLRHTKEYTAWMCVQIYHKMYTVYTCTGCQMPDQKWLYTDVYVQTCMWMYWYDRDRLPRVTYCCLIKNYYIL